MAAFRIVNMCGGPFRESFGEYVLPIMSKDILVNLNTIESDGFVMIGESR